MKSNSSTKDFVLMALFAAIICLLAFVPYLGYIPLGVINATTIHIPVIIGSLFLGPKRGAVLGGVFGLTSLLNNTFKGGLTAFVFSPFYSVNIEGTPVLSAFKSLLICFVPRILIGVAAYYACALLYRVLKGKMRAALYIAAGLAGSLTNTLLVMHGIFLLFGNAYAAAKGMEFNALYYSILGIIGANGVPEAIVASLLTAAACPVLRRIRPLYCEQSRSKRSEG
ncbi:MAG: ECF transporter S component [Ruminococcus sp.]|nr:ECF transporter S component [Ruminococcus sp.]